MNYEYKLTLQFRDIKLFTDTYVFNLSIGAVESLLTIHWSNPVWRYRILPNVPSATCRVEYMYVLFSRGRKTDASGVVHICRELPCANSARIVGQFYLYSDFHNFDFTSIVTATKLLV